MAVITHTDRGVEVLVAEGDGPRRLHVREVPDGAFLHMTTDRIVLGPGAIDAVMEVLQRAKAGAIPRTPATAVTLTVACPPERVETRSWRRWVLRWWRGS